MDDLTPKNLFLQSLERCASNDDFIPAFYSRFLSTSEEIREKFKDTDFQQQNQMLLRALRLAAGATAGDPEALREIRERAETHDRNHLDIEPRHYESWLNAAIKTASEFDREWDSFTASAWQEILGHVVSHMIRHY